MSNLPSLNGVPAVNTDLLAHALTDSKATTNSESTTTTTIQTNSAGASTFALVPQYNGRESYEAISAPLVSAKSPSALDKHTYGALWQSQWRECSQVAPGAVLGYRGLRVRLGMHAGVDGDTFVAFNTVMQRYHYTGALHGYTCMHYPEVRAAQCWYSAVNTDAEPCVPTHPSAMHVFLASLAHASLRYWSVPELMCSQCMLCHCLCR